MIHPILVVEDDKDIRECITEVLVDHGYTSLAAANGQEALDCLHGTPDRAPCLILLDMMMPIMDGWQFRAAVLGDEAYRSTPVVILTAQADAEKIAKEIGADDFLRIPLSVATLLAAIDRYCRHD